VYDSGIPPELSADKCSCWIAETTGDVHGRTLHTAGLAGRGNLCQGADLCETADPSTSRTGTTA